MAGVIDEDLWTVREKERVALIAAGHALDEMVSAFLKKLREYEDIDYNDSLRIEDDIVFPAASGGECILCGTGKYPNG